MAYSPSIQAQPGRDFLLKVDIGGSPTSFITVGGLRNTSATFNGAAVDISNVASGGFQEMFPGAGLKSMNITSDGIMDGNELGGITAIAQAAINEEVIEVQLISGHGDQFLYFATVGSFTRTGPHDGVETFSVALNSTGPITYIPAT